MHPKFKLTLDDLKVESFDAHLVAHAIGGQTVKALSAETAGGCTFDTPCYTDPYYCGNSQQANCTQVNCTDSTWSICQSVGCSATGCQSGWSCANTCTCPTNNCTVNYTECNCV